MGVERYKYRLMGQHPVADYEALFSRERFFSDNPEDTNLRLETRADLYDDMHARFDSAQFVGDKIPSCTTGYSSSTRHSRSAR